MHAVEIEHFLGDLLGYWSRERKAYPEMSGPGRRSVLVAVTVCPVVGIDGDGDGQRRSSQHQLTPGMAAWCPVRLNNHEWSPLL